MTPSKIVVTVLGVAAIAWVLWYFLAAPIRPASGRSKPKTR